MEKILLKLYILPVPFQLTPARGRKRQLVEWLIISCNFNSPPRGDENGAVSISYFEGTISTHPREGTKTVYLQPRTRDFLFQLTPARGRKHLQQGIVGAERHFNSPPRGDENRRGIGCVLRLPYFNSPPRGDENQSGP